MRPALLRLLKRPSAVSVLDSLIATPIGVEQLASRYKCLRRHSGDSNQKAALKEAESNPSVGNDLPERQPQVPSRPQLSFRVYDIDSPGVDHPPVSKKKKGRVTGDSARSLALQPERLEFESNVGHTDDIGTRLVDGAAHRHDFVLWEELLRYRQRHYGDRGTLDIWEGLTARGDIVQLPVSGERANFFWMTFVDLALKRDIFMKELTNYELELWNKTGQRWDRFYESVVGGFLERGLVQKAVEWHIKLPCSHLTHPNDVLRVLQPAISLTSERKTHGIMSMNGRRLSVSPGIRAFQSICQDVDGHRIYEVVIGKLLQHGKTEDAVAMHAFLIARQDHPPAYESMRPLIEHTKTYGPWHIYQELQQYANRQFARQAKSVDEGPTEDVATDEVLVEEKPFKDDFGARIFATKALNFDMILAGLKMFGVPAIGPKSLREMAVRAHGGQDILEKLQMLQKSGISIGDSVFARLLRKLASENREILLSDLLRSDQHPEVLEDAHMQETLLVSHYIARDWRQYNMTLAILGELSEGSDMSNIHFRKHIAAGEWTFASKVVDEMAVRGKTLSKPSINFMVEQVLTPRRRGVGPRHGRVHPMEEIGLVLGVLKRVVLTGGSVPPDLWVELLKRIGMSKHPRYWDTVRDPCLWLARQYSSSAKRTSIPWTAASTQTTKTTPHSRSSRTLKAIFTRDLQYAIVAWGFRMRLSSSDTKVYNPFGKEGEQLIPWVRGLILLRELEQNGVRLDVEMIRWALRHRLAVLFSQPTLSRRRMNRMLRRENPYDVQRVIEDIKRAWGDPSIFEGLEERDLHELVNPPHSARTLVRNQRLLSYSHPRRRVALLNSI